LLLAPKYPNPLITAKNPNSYWQKPPRFIPTVDKAKKMAKGLCYFCDQPLERGHKCGNKEKQLFLVEVMGEVDGKEEVDKDVGEAENEMENIVPQISLNVMSGSVGFQAMRVNGHARKKQIHILIDSGSTHNFLDENLAKKLGCKLETMTAQSVTIVNGNRMQCHYACREFKWTLHSTEFQYEVYLLPLGACDLVLGVQWLSTLGTIKWNFSQMRMKFTYATRLHKLRGMNKGVAQLMSQENLPKALQTTTQLFMLQCTLEESFSLLSLTAAPSGIPQQMQMLLDSFEDIFKEPTGLPPPEDTLTIGFV